MYKLVWPYRVDGRSKVYLETESGDEVRGEGLGGKGLGEGVGLKCRGAQVRV